MKESRWTLLEYNDKKKRNVDLKCQESYITKILKKYELENVNIVKKDVNPVAFSYLNLNSI